VVVLCEVAIEVILVGRSSYHVLKAFVGVSQIGHVGQAVRAGGIAVSVGKVIDDVETQIRHLPSAVVSFEVAVEVVGDIAFGVVVCLNLMASKAQLADCPRRRHIPQIL